MAGKRARAGGELGSTEKEVLLWIWDSNQSLWKDITKHVIEFKLHQSLNNPSKFEAKLVWDSQLKELLKRGAKLAITAQTALLDKLDVDEVKVSRDHIAEVVAFSSAGEQRSLVRETVGTNSFADTSAQEVLEWINDGVCQIGSSVTDKVSLNLSHERRCEALDALVSKLNGVEWWFSYPEPLYMDELGQDYVNLGTKGESKDVTLKLGVNAYRVGSKDSNLSKLNSVKIRGYGSDLTLEPLEVEHYLATTKHTTLAKQVDTKLTQAAQPTDTTLYVVSTEGFPDSGVLLIGNEKISYSGKTSNSFTGCTRGYGDTTAQYHEEGVEVINYGTTSNEGRVDIELNEGLGLEVGDKIKIGMEICEVVAKTSETQLTVQRGSDPYAHSAGAPVYFYYDSGTGDTFTKDSPEAGSDIALNGIHEASFHDNQSRYKDDLDKKAYYLLTQRQNAASFVVSCSDPIDIASKVRYGDTIKVEDSELGNVEYRVAELEFGFSIQRAGCYLDLTLNRQHEYYTLGLKEGIGTDTTRPVQALVKRLNKWAEFDGANLRIKPPAGGNVMIETGSYMIGSVPGIALRILGHGTTELMSDRTLRIGVTPEATTSDAVEFYGKAPSGTSELAFQIVPDTGNQCKIQLKSRLDTSTYSIFTSEPTKTVQIEDSHLQLSFNHELRFLDTYGTIGLKISIDESNEAKIEASEKLNITSSEIIRIESTGSDVKIYSSVDAYVDASEDVWISATTGDITLASGGNIRLEPDGDVVVYNTDLELESSRIVLWDGSYYSYIEQSGADLEIDLYDTTDWLYLYGNLDVYNDIDAGDDIWADDDIDCGGNKYATHLAGNKLVNTYVVEATEVWLVDMGTSKLRNGECYVKLDEQFRKIIHVGDDELSLTDENPYRVFLTPLGDCNGLYVAKKDKDGFLVKELRGGKSNVQFEWVVYAKRGNTYFLDPNRKFYNLRLQESKCGLKRLIKARDLKGEKKEKFEALRKQLGLELDKLQAELGVGDKDEAGKKVSRE